MLYADVILPLTVDGTFTYGVPDSLRSSITIGCRAIVSFGKKRFYTAIVLRVKEQKEVLPNIKDIVATLDEYPIVNQTQLDLWQWIASYYMCSLGDVYKAALPSSLKLESETFVVANPEFESNAPLSPSEKKLFQLLSTSKAQTIGELEKASGISNIVPTIKSLVEKNAAFTSERVENDYAPKTESAVRLIRQFSEQELHALLDSLDKAKKQQHLLSVFLSINKTCITKKELLDTASSSSAILNELVKKNILEIYPYEVNRINYGETDLEAAHELNEYQHGAYEKIKHSFSEKNTTLLHGITSSGKTEVYIQLIKDAIGQGKQVLYLLPEIALTTQITERLKKIFGNKLAVYHSRFNDNERAETWNRLLNDLECQVVLGARSAVFLPFRNLGLVIVDEEHESSYKQQDPAPRYNARNTAIVLAGMSNAKTLLGTATPSIETYHNALSGRYGLVTLDKRYLDIAPPKISIIDTKDLRRRKQMKYALSPQLIQRVETSLAKGEQVILFQNRRGFASMLECKTCAWTPRCSHCDISLTYHKGQRLMMCHYCGATYNVPTACPNCETETLNTLGYGTERVEEEVRELFPKAVIARMDLDTTRGKKSYQRIISDFEEQKTDILIGTQMLSKGLDFDNVSTVGILNADTLLNYPDFRAHERAFQLMTQVSGRAGRKNKQGLVILQTAHPTHPVVKHVQEHNYRSFYQHQVEERHVFHYPPFYRLIAISLKGKNERLTDEAAKLFANALRQSFGQRVLGATKPPVAWVQNLHIRKIVLKIENQASITQVRELLKSHQHTILSQETYRSVRVQYDVDPM